MPRQQADWRWKKYVKQQRQRLERNPELAVCWLCGNPINMQLPPTHAQGFTLDHIIPLAQGGGLHDETRPAHRSCNSQRSDGRKTKNQPKTIVEW